MELEKKIELTQQILKQAVEISETTEHDIFFFWMPHTNSIDITIHRGGWDMNKCGARVAVYFDGDGYVEGEFANVLAVLDSLKDKK
jgi:hypothetical protein